MALPSQYRRVINRRSHMSRHRRAKRRIRMAVSIVALLAACVAAWIWWPEEFRLTGGDEPGIDPAPVTAAQTGTDDFPPPTDETLLVAADSATAQPPLGTPAEPAPPVETPDDEEAKADVELTPPTSGTPTPATTQPPPALVSITNDTSETERDAPPAAPPPDTRAPLESPARDRAMQRIETARQLAAANDPVTARRQFSEALASGALSAAEAAAVRGELEQLNAQLVFGPTVAPNDPYALRYVVQPGDSLERIVKRLSLQVDWRFIQRINQIARPERIQAGQQIKLITGPFHAVVHKDAYRMDLFLGDTSRRDYVCSFQVGLGEVDSTPEGLFRVRPRSKVVNPEWVNPRTRERFAPDDPRNPIGEYWIGLEGLDESIRALTAYGIHGTIEPESIGRQMSMGCVRMLPDDVAVVYEMLVDGSSTVRIRGR